MLLTPSFLSNFASSFGTFIPILEVRKADRSLLLVLLEAVRRLGVLLDRLVRGALFVSRLLLLVRYFEERVLYLLDAYSLCLDISL
jgi:hypothetical protein